MKDSLATTIETRFIKNGKLIEEGKLSKLRPWLRKNVGSMNAIKNWCLVQTNEAETADAPLNDYCATVIGGVRDDLPFKDFYIKTSFMYLMP